MKNLNDSELIKIDGGALNMGAIVGIAAGITFIIGSSYGLSPKVKSESDFKLSVSRMTFPHQLAKGMLLEQIYRSFKILNNETYHK